MWQLIYEYTCQSESVPWTALHFMAMTYLQKHRNIRKFISSGEYVHTMFGLHKMVSDSPVRSLNCFRPTVNTSPAIAIQTCKAQHMLGYFTVRLCSSSTSGDGLDLLTHVGNLPCIMNFISVKKYEFMHPCLQGPHAMCAKLTAS